MEKLISYPISVIYYLCFGLTLVIFHPIQLICFNVFGYQTHKKSVDYLNFFLTKCTNILGTRYTFENIDTIPKDAPIIFVSNHQSLYDIIGIDECQFFWDLHSFLKKHEETNKTIVVSGLYADSNLEQFGDLLKCFPFADEITMLQSKCIVCNKNTLHTRNKQEKKTQIEIGGEDMYQPMCKKCFNK